MIRGHGNTHEVHEMGLMIRKCVLDDIPALHEFLCKAFVDTFGAVNTPDNMKAYLSKAFNTDKLKEELLNNDSVFYLLFVDNVLSGSIKINDGEAQTDIKDPQALEIERLYVAVKSKGKGLGGVLLKKALDVAKTRKKSYVWLGVWEKNDRAIRFYRKNGFFTAGRHSFFLGEDEQTDLIMRKDIG